MRQFSYFTASIILSSSIAVKCDDQKFNLISPEHWPDFKIEHYHYPVMAGMARIQGQVILAIFIKQDGSVLQVKAISGPPQLRPYAESLLKDYKFSNMPTSKSGPWIFFASADFFALSKRIFITPTKKEQIPPPQTQK